MQMSDLAIAYQSKSDEELLQLARSSGELTPDAQSVLKTELARRRISEDGDAAGDILELGTRETFFQRSAKPISDLVAEVSRLYRVHFLLFIMIMAPAVVLGYFLIILCNQQATEIARHLPTNYTVLQHKPEIIEIMLIRISGQFGSWLASAVSFGAICFAIDQLTAGEQPSALDCFAGVREQFAPFLRISLLLFALSGAVLWVGGLALPLATIWIMEKLQWHHIRGSLLQALWFGCSALGLLLISRFALAMPAVMLDECKISQAMFRSDELTEGKWLTLAALLAKSLVGGYLAWMVPWWVVGFLWPYIQLPVWFATAVSIAGVTVAEPFMLIGFALLYVNASPAPSAVPDALAPHQQFS